MRRTVLLVDDEPDILLVARLLLEDAGYQVISAADGKEALELVEAEDPDVMFLDLAMPGTDGWGVLSELRRRGKQLPVIVLSAHASPATMERTVELGARGYVQKPFRRADLTRALDAVLA